MINFYIGEKSVDKNLFTASLSKNINEEVDEIFDNKLNESYPYLMVFGNSYSLSGTLKKDINTYNKAKKDFNNYHRWKLLDNLENQGIIKVNNVVYKIIYSDIN